jgi:hypothetical protein
VATRSVTAGRILAATGLASIRVLLEPMVRTLRRRAAFAVAVGLLWLAALCFALVALTLFVGSYVGLPLASLAIAVALAGIAALLHYIASGR